MVLLFTCLQYKSFENTVRKGGIALPFLTVFSALLGNFLAYCGKNTVGKGEISHDEQCYVHTQFYLALYMCVFILNSFPCGYF